MKNTKKLSLKTQTIRSLQTNELTHAVGGSLSLSVYNPSGGIIYNPSGGITSLNPSGGSYNPSGGSH